MSGAREKAVEAAIVAWLESASDYTRLRVSIKAACEAYETALREAGFAVVPVEPTPEMYDAGKGAMPVEVDYWQEGDTLRSKMRAPAQCVDPRTVYSAMLTASQGPGGDT